MSAMEVEVKFRVADIRALESTLREIGFREVTPRTFERNVLFDTRDRRLRAQQAILRVRQYGDRWIVTHKRLPDNHDPAARHKSRVETETVVDDGEAIGTIFSQLGYLPSFAYEKWRTEYADHTGHCVLDETPIGIFAELEGPPEWIDATAKRLRLDPSALMTLSYGRLFDQWKQETGSSAGNLTFDEIEAPQKK
ncbi:class IV adenylate cyclase [Paracidobacterium acidisoli]|uniref:CYTH domain-containing protein n=1 Tax=Paracidobacterium acidisoli TaxID=2303751 RepID=A0A372IVE8_9BACT|nr:class IV adenylate cyclase [Paracidobacterium acidisoli]MBT9329820.1 class IV adenylate cyclase [Paracidobacterium acidisoli]